MSASSALDCSDIDRYLGKPCDSSPLRESIGNNDIRRWVHAMHYPNLLHYDPSFSAQSRWGKLLAPQSFCIATDDGHGAVPACVGRIPNSHLLFGGDEWWFYGPRVYGGDIVRNERIPFDYVVKDTKFAGPTCFQRGDNNYYNQRGEQIAKQRSTAIRYQAAAGAASTDMSNAEDPAWSDAELEALEDRKLQWIRMLHELGHGKRYWDDAQVGVQLPERVFGPHSIASLTTEWRAYLVNTWGTMNLRINDLEAMGFTREMAGYENDPAMQLVNPELTDGAYFGPSRGHLFPRWARRIGMPRAYGYGASMGSWITDYLSGEIIGKLVDEKGRNVVAVSVKMANQKGVTLATAKAEIELPTR
jgi:hypothetical protein